MSSAATQFTIKSKWLKAGDNYEAQVRALGDKTNTKNSKWSGAVKFTAPSTSQPTATPIPTAVPTATPQQGPRDLPKLEAYSMVSGCDGVSSVCEIHVFWVRERVSAYGCDIAISYDIKWEKPDGSTALANVPANCDSSAYYRYVLKGSQVNHAKKGGNYFVIVRPLGDGVLYEKEGPSSRAEEL